MYVLGITNMKGALAIVLCGCDDEDDRLTVVYKIQIIDFSKTNAEEPAAQEADKDKSEAAENTSK